MCQFRIHRRARYPLGNSQTQIVDHGCDGVHHVKHTTILYHARANEPVTPQHIGFDLEGACDGTCGSENIGEFEYAPMISPSRPRPIAESGSSRGSVVHEFVTDWG